MTDFFRSALPRVRRTLLWLGTGGALVLPLIAFTNTWKYLIPLGALTTGGLLAGGRWWRAPGLAFFAACYGWQLLSTLIHGEHIVSANYAPLLVYPAVYALARSHPRRRAWIGRSVVLVLVAGVVLAWVQFAVGHDEHAGASWFIDPSRPAWLRGTGFVGHHLHASIQFACGVLIALLPGLALHPALRWSAIVILASGVLITKCRTMLVAAGLVEGVLLMARRFSWWRWGACLAFAVALLAFFLTTDQERIGRMMQLDDPRLGIWPVVIDMIEDAPLLGTGGKDAYTATWLVRTEGLDLHPAGRFHAHNCALALASTYGVPAALAFVLFLLAIAWRSWRCPDERLRPIGLAAVVLMLVAGLFEDYTGNARAMMAWCFLLALLFADMDAAEAETTSAPTTIDSAPAVEEAPTTSDPAVS